MKPLSLLFLGVVVVGWAASGVDWSREAVAVDVEAGGVYPADSPLPEMAPLEQKAQRWERMERRRVESQPNLIGRFQATAYGSPSGHGCYIVDTMTGQTWHILNGQPPQVVASGLTPYAPQPAMPTPAMNLPEPMMTPTPSYTESMPGVGTSPPPTQSNVVPTPKSAEPTPDAAD